MRGCRLLLIVVDVRKCIFHTRRNHEFEHDRSEVFGGGSAVALCP